jgi:hypothetical protein
MQRSFLTQLQAVKEHKLLTYCHAVFQFFSSTSKMWIIILKNLGFISVLLEIVSYTLFIRPLRIQKRGSNSSANAQEILRYKCAFK